MRTGRLNGSYVVTGISHTITPEAWHVTYEFDPDGTVASPTMTPSPTAQPVRTLTATNVLSAASGWAINSQSFVRDGRVIAFAAEFKRTGAQINLTSPDHTNQQIGSIDPAWSPQVISMVATSQGFRHVAMTAANTVVVTGGLSDTSSANANILTNDVISFSGVYLLTEGL